MTPTPPDAPSEPDAEFDRRQDAMKDQLRKDVASWSKSRADTAGETSGLGMASVARKSASAPAARVARPKKNQTATTAPVPAEKKPFRMSYDGTTDRAYNAERTKLRIT
jgi:hypothetical protein